MRNVWGAGRVVPKIGGTVRTTGLGGFTMVILESRECILIDSDCRLIDLSDSMPVIEMKLVL